MLLCNEKYIEIGPESPANVGQKEIDCIERRRPKTSV